MLTLLLLIACEPAPPGPSPSAEIVVPLQWGRVRGTLPATRFHLDEAALAGTALWIDGAWWRVDLDLDGVALPPVFPLFGPIEVPLPPLAAGDHTLAVSVALPTTEEPVLALTNKNNSLRGGRAELRIRGEAHLGALAVPLLDGRLAPTVHAVGAPAGATIELAVTRDGEVEAAWSAVPAGESFAPRAWRGERWDIGDPHLYVATAVLRDGSGALLDVHSERVGFHESRLDDGVLHLNGRPSPLLALAVDVVQDATATLTSLADAGGNALEIHGAVTGGAFFARFDEWGLPIVHMPRCDGFLWRDGRDPNKIWPALAAELGVQDARLLAASASRPSMLAWICEGSENLRSEACGRLHDDPLRRPVLGLDVAGAGASGGHRRQATVPTWVIEIGPSRDGRMSSVADIATALVAGTGPGGPGGVFPPAVNGGDPAEWRTAWNGVAKTLGARSWKPGSHRAPSVVVVTGLAVGQIATVEAPWMATRGAVADGTGQARIEIWYEGPATVRAGERTFPVTLAADRWDGLRRAGVSTVVEAAP